MLELEKETESQRFSLKDSKILEFGWILQNPVEFTKFVKMHRTLIDFIRILRDLLKFFRIPHNLQQFVKVC